MLFHVFIVCNKFAVNRDRTTSPKNNYIIVVKEAL